MLELEAALVSVCNAQTPPQNNISANSLTSVSVIIILKPRISFLVKELSKKDVIDYISNELITSKISKSKDSANKSMKV